MSRDWNIIDETPLAEPPEPPANDGLNQRRIRAIVFDRRAADRARLRAILVPIACAAVTAMAAVQAWSMRATHPERAGFSLAIAVAALWIGLRAALRHPPSRNERPHAPREHPDFSELSAGPSAADRLERMHSDDPRPRPGRAK